MTKSSVILLILLYLLSVIITSCSYAIERTDYKKQQREKSGVNPEANDIVFQKYAMLDANEFEKVGEIKLVPKDFTVNCSESSALTILKKEAINLGADLINIIDETRPRDLTDCYRCHAEFYISKTNKEIKSSSAFKVENVKEREKEDAHSGDFVWGIIVAIILGLLTGEMLSSQKNK